MHSRSKSGKEPVDWFRLGYLSGDQSGAGLPVYYRRKLDHGGLQPKIRFEDATLNVLVDEKLVANEEWRKAMVALATDVSRMREEFTSVKTAAARASLPQVMLLPAALHDSFYRTGLLYEGFNPIRLLELTVPDRIAVLRKHFLRPYGSSSQS